MNVLYILLSLLLIILLSYLIYDIYNKFLNKRILKINKELVNSYTELCAKYENVVDLIKVQEIFSKYKKYSSLAKKKQEKLSSNLNNDKSIKK